MNNINFANPWLLLLGVLMIIIVITSFVISVRKENKTTNNVISFIIHLILCVLVALGISETTFETVITETNIYVLADVSYSSNKNLDLIDEYIVSLKDDSPKNSKIGVVCFGKDYELLVELGEELVSVKEANIDDSQTNIASALEYTGTLFKDNVIKRIVIISDGKETTQSNIVSIVQGLSLDNIYVDAIYLDNNLKEDDKEIQVSDIDFVDSTYLNIDEKAYVLVESSYNAKGYLNLYCDGVLYKEKAISFNVGYNTIPFELNTTDAGVHNYEVKVVCDDDTSSYNNSYFFTQEVVDKVKMLFVSSSESDREKALELYGDIADIDFYINNPDVPFTVEELCVYDEFVLSNIDIRTIYNYTQFVSSLDTLVSEFGKSLITFGNTYIQNNYEDETLMALNDMLPVKFGNGENDEKLVTLVIDISRSMEQIDKLNIAKESACVILDNLEDDVLVMVIAFFGEVGTVFQPTKASEREVMKEKIRSLDPRQGTFMGAALQFTYSFITSLPYSKNEVLLISDGLPYGEQQAAAKGIVTKMSLANIILSTIHILTDTGEALMRELANIGKGYYYYIKDLKNVESLILDEVMNSLTEVILESNESSVSILLSKNELVKGIESLPNIKGLYNNQKKTSATVVLNATYTDNRDFKYEIPLYSYWSYGNGKVSSFASTLSGVWTESWYENEESKQVFENVASVNRPLERIDSAFIISHVSGNVETDLTVSAPTINKNSALNVNITYPNGDVFTKELLFDGQNYICSFDSEDAGLYKVEVSYSLGELNYVTDYSFTISYLPEYNSFTVFEASNLYYMVSMNGQISEDGNLELDNSNSVMQKYIFDFTPIIMIISVCLFIIDIFVRKLRWADIKSLFSKKIKKEVK